MLIKNTSEHYGSLTKILHSIILSIIIALLILGHIMGYFSDSLRLNLYNTHKAFGILVLFLGIIFVLWSSQNIKPAYPETLKPWEKLAAHGVRYALYVAMIAMPLFGWCFSTAYGKTTSFFGLFTLAAPVPVDLRWAGFFASAHKCTGWIIVALVLLHTVAALKHHIIDRNNVLERMFNFKK